MSKVQKTHDFIETRQALEPALASSERQKLNPTPNITEINLKKFVINRNQTSNNHVKRLKIHFLIDIITSIRIHQKNIIIDV